MDFVITPVHTTAASDQTQLQLKLRSQHDAAHRGLENETLFNVVDSQVAIAADQSNARFNLKPRSAECLPGKIGLRAKATDVEPAQQKNARRKTHTSPGTD